MMQINWQIWLLLFGPAIFAFTVGGAFWAYCMKVANSNNDAAKRFKLYTWAILPVASLLYSSFILLQLSPSQRETIFISMNSTVLTLALSAGIAGAISICIYQLEKYFSRYDAAQRLAFLTAEYRELPGLIIIAPITEEFVFRVYGSLILETLSTPFAALLTSIAFALIHVKPILILFSFFIGLSFYFIYIYTNDFSIIVTAHASMNLTTWILMRKEEASYRKYAAKLHE